MNQSDIAKWLGRLHNCGMKPKALSLADVDNLSEFSRRSGIPRRTLTRIRNAPADYQVSPVTQLALDSALKRLHRAIVKMTPPTNQAEDQQ
jgi:hypothetical protein